MKTRKFVSLGLAALMSLSLAAPVFAEDPNMETVLTATYTKPDIKVTVPQTGAVALNPLGLDVDLSADNSAPTGEVVKGQQIVTNPTFIVNTSKMDLSVSATVSTAITGKDDTSKLKLTTSQQALVGDETTPGKTDKSAFVFFQMASTTLTDTADPSLNNKAAAGWAYDYTETVTDGVVTPKEGCLILNGTRAVTGSKLVTLKAAADDGSVVNGGIAQMRLSGKLVQQPKIEWTADDKIAATVTFTFLPAVSG